LAWSSLRLGNRCPYTSKVIAIELCPNTSHCRGSFSMWSEAPPRLPPATASSCASFETTYYMTLSLLGGKKMARSQISGAQLRARHGVGLGTECCRCPMSPMGR
jgi:hypothetical protein